MSLQGRSMQHLSHQVGNTLPCCALKRACSAAVSGKFRGTCVQGTPSQSSLSKAKYMYSQSPRKATSATDRTPVTRELHPTRVVPTSPKVPRSAPHARCVPQLVGRYSSVRPGGPLSTRLTELSGPGFPKASSSSRLRGHTHSVQQELACSSAPLAKDRRHSATGPEAANIPQHGLLQYHCAPRGSVTGYSSPKHILKQRVRSHAVLGHAHVTVRAASGATLSQNGSSGRTKTACKQNEPAALGEPHEEGGEDVSFHTLQYSSLSDSRIEFHADCVEKSAMRVPIYNPSRNAEGIHPTCSSSSAKPRGRYSNVLPAGGTGESADVRELKNASSNADGACRGEGGTAHITTRKCLGTTVTPASSCALSQKAQPTAHTGLPPKCSYTSVGDSRPGSETAGASSISNRKITTSCPSSAVAEGPRRSPEVSRCTLAGQVKHLNSNRSCVWERVFPVKKTTVHRATQSTNPMKLPGGHASLKRRGKVLCVLPSSPTSLPTRTGRRTLCNIHGTTRLSSRKRSGTRSLTAQKDSDCASSVSIQTNLSFPFTTFGDKGHEVEKGLQSNASDTILKHGHPEAPHVMLPQFRQQTTSSDAGDPALASQIIEHSWMFPRDEYRPPLSPHIPFSLDEDEDATASAVLVSLNEEMPAVKQEASKEDEKSNQATRCWVKSPAEKNEHGQSTSPGIYPIGGVGGSAERCRRRTCTTQESSNGENLQAAAARGCEHLGNVEQIRDVSDVDKTGVPQSEKLMTTAEGLAGASFPASQREGRSHTPPTDWCTTLSTAWLSSSATATENVICVTSPCECIHKDYEFKIKNETTVEPSKEYRYSTRYERKLGQQTPLTVNTLSRVAVPAQRRDYSIANENNLVISQPNAVLAGGHSRLTEATCERGFSSTAHTEHTSVSECAGHTRDSADVANGSIPSVVYQAHVQHRAQWEPKGEHGREQLCEADWHNHADRVASERAADRKAISVSFRARKHIHDGLGHAASQQQVVSKALCAYGYKSRSTYPPSVESGIFDRANAFARCGRLPVGCASKSCSRSTSLDGTRKQDRSPSQAADSGVDPSVRYLIHRESTRGTTDSLDDESTTSDDCSSDCSSRDTFGSSPVVRQVYSPPRDAQLSLRSVYGDSSETPFQSQRHTSPVAAHVNQGKRQALEVSPRTCLWLHERSLGGRRRVQSQSPPAGMGQTRWNSRSALSALVKVAKDLDAARRLSVSRQTKSANETKLPEERQNSALSFGSNCKKHSDTEEKEQPHARGLTMWRFWGWTFGRRKHEGRIKREGR